MGKRGPQPFAEKGQFAVVEGAFDKRPAPPEDLSPAESVIWKAIVAGEAAEVFATEATRRMLKNLVRHQATADMVSGVINLFEAGWLKSEDGVSRFNDLIKIRDREVHATVGLATKLRLTNQARFTAAAASTATRNAPTGLKPWEA